MVVGHRSDFQGIDKIHRIFKKPYTDLGVHASKE